MLKTEKMRAFLIKFAFYAVCLGLAYLVVKYAMPFLTPFIFGFFIAFILKPIINKISSKTNLNRKGVAAGILIIFYVIIGTLLTVLGTRIVIAVRDIFVSLPAFYDTSISPALYEIQIKIETAAKNFTPEVLDFINAAGDSITNSLSTFITTISSGAITAATGAATRVPTFFINFLLTIIVSFFCVVDYYKIINFITKQLPLPAKDMLFKIKKSGVDVVFKFGKAYAMLMSITFIELCVGFALLRVDNFILIALAVAAVDILPILGTGTILIPWGLINLITGNVPFGVAIIIIYAIITIVRQTLEPRIVGKQIGLYPLVTLMCMFIGAQLFGFLGLFGLPIAVTIIVQLNTSEEFNIIKK